MNKHVTRKGNVSVTFDFQLSRGFYRLKYQPQEIIYWTADLANTYLGERLGKYQVVLGCFRNFGIRIGIVEDVSKYCYWYWVLLRAIQSIGIGYC